VLCCSVGYGAFGEACQLGLGALRGADVLSRLYEVALDSFVSIGAIFVGGVERESWPGGVVPGLDGFEPSGFDRVTGGGVEVFDEYPSAG
jgi:hypothetical protein